MVIASLEFQKKLEKTEFFQEILVADISVEVLFGMFFLTFSNADVVLQKENFFEKLIPLQKSFLPLGLDH